MIPIERSEVTHYQTLLLNHLLPSITGTIPITGRRLQLIGAQRIVGPVRPENMENILANYNFSFSITPPGNIRTRNWMNMRTSTFPRGLGIGNRVFLNWQDMEIFLNNFLSDHLNYPMINDLLISRLKLPIDSINLINSFSQKNRRSIRKFPRKSSKKKKSIRVKKKR